MEAPTDIFVNQKGHKITLLGVMHIAEQPFWSKLTQTLLNTKNTVHLEGVKPFNKETSVATVEEQNKMDSLLKVASFSRILAKETGLVFQLDGIKTALTDAGTALPETGWQNVDMNVQAAVKHINADELNETAASLDKLVTEFQKDDAPFSLGSFMLFMIRNPKILKALTFFTQLTKKDKNEALDALQGFILDDRNEYAIAEALKVENDVILVWGAAHLEGMGKLLKKAGYRHQQRKWNLLISKGFTIPKKAPEDAFLKEYARRQNA